MLRAVFVLMVVTAMVWDIRTRRIPNVLSVLLLAGGTLFSVMLQPPLAGLRNSMFGVAPVPLQMPGQAQRSFVDILQGLHCNCNW